MGKYLKIFDTTSEYNSAKNNLELPNVSICDDDSTTVYYNPYDPYRGHEYVDLGLPSGTLWATMNVGANSETDYGNYYMYGKGSTQYNSQDAPYDGTEKPLADSADTAVQVWGGLWHMPTESQIWELYHEVEYETLQYEYVTNFKNSGINGGKFTANNGNYLFIPTSGYYNENGILYGDTEDVIILSSDKDKALSMYMSPYILSYYNLSYGCSVRPVIG